MPPHASRYAHRGPTSHAVGCSRAARRWQARRASTNVADRGTVSLYSAHAGGVMAATPLAAPPDLLRDLVLANRILAHEGVVDAFGHISARHPDDPGRFI